jgi:hypothetical protein
MLRSSIRPRVLRRPATAAAAVATTLAATLAATLVAMLAATPLQSQSVSPPTAFRQVRTETTAAPASAYATLARFQHDLCNINRGHAGLPARPFPSLPDPFVLERTWQATNGQDFVLRTRRFRIDVAADTTADENDCGARLAWSEVAVIHRGGRTTRIERSSDTPAQIDRNAYFGGISPVRPEDFPIRRAASSTLSLRCGRPGEYAPAAAFPGAAIEEICVAASVPGFHDEDGMPLTLGMRGRVSLSGADFAMAVRTVADGAFQPTAATWEPATYVTAGPP